MALSKPTTCLGCPLYQDGQGFVPDELVDGAPVFVLMQNPGEQEERQGAPAVGRTGQRMNTTYLPIAGLERGRTVSVGNVLRCRWARSDELPPEPTLSGAMGHCMAAHFRPPASTRLIVAQGALAWRALGQRTSVTKWRGYLAEATDG